MTFTYVGDLSTNLDTVRFHIGDTDSAGYFLEDETITALITIEGSVGGAVVACLKYIISQLSKPDFKADWLSVDHKAAAAGYRVLLNDKRTEFGVAALTATATTVYREDSEQDSDRDYTA